MPNKKIEGFKPSNLDELREELEVALEQVSGKYGIIFKIGSFSYTNDSFDFKTNVRVEGTKSEEEVRKELEVEHLESFTDYKKGDEIKVEGLGIAIVKGFNMRARKYKLLVKYNGQSYGIRNKTYPKV